MKGIDIFCASQASTAICVSMEPGSSSSSAIDQGGRAIDRHNPIIRDARRSSVKTLTTPCSSQSPINPKPYHQLHQKNRKTTGKSNDQIKKASAKNVDQYGKSSAKPLDMLRKSSAKFVDLISPPGSSRYLLSEPPFFDVLPDFDPVLALVPVEPKKAKAVNLDDDSPVLKPSSSSGSSDSKPSSSSGSADQVRNLLSPPLQSEWSPGKVSGQFMETTPVLNIVMVKVLDKIRYNSNLLVVLSVCEKGCSTSICFLRRNLTFS